MAERLPVVAGDLNAWGAILNAYLQVDHGSDGHHTVVVTNGGAVSGPALTAVGQTTTGIYFPAADQLAHAIAGVQRLRHIGSNVLIGTAATARNTTVTGALEVHHNSPSVSGTSAPGILLMDNHDAASADVGNTVSAYASEEQQGNIIWQWRDATTNNAKLTLGLRTTAASVNAIATAVKSGNADGTCFWKFGPAATAPANYFEVESAAGVRAKFFRTGSAPALALDADGTDGYVGTTGGGNLILRVSDVEGARLTTERAWAIIDGITAPATLAGFAQIYVDTADGDLKVKFGDGVTKTIVTDT